MDLDQNQPKRRELWKNIQDSLDTPEFREHLKREFPDDADQWTDPVTRRQFVKLSGASLALAGVVGCSPRPADPRHIVPYVKQPERIVPGLPLFFATASTLNGVATGVIAKSREGRPIKLEGNPDHPGSLGGTDVFTQAEILNLYDPDRSAAVTHLGAASTWDNALSAIRTELAKSDNGAGVRLLTGTVTSPTLGAKIKAFLEAYPEAKWVQYDPAGNDSARVGSRRAFGKYVNTTYDLTKAEVVLSLDSDFLSAMGQGAVRYTRDFMANRKNIEAHGDHYHAAMNRLYVVETMLTCTGASADHRLPLKPSDVEKFARMLARELGVAGTPEGSIDGDLAELAGEWVKPLAKNLKDAGSAAVVIPGECQPASVHALCHAINQALGNTGETVRYTQPIEAAATDQLAEVTALSQEMAAGDVKCLLILGGNPVYNAPADLDFLSALKAVPVRVHWSLYVDETSVNCHWHLPATHFLETWGDARAFDGTVTIQQPLIAPLYSGRSESEILSSLLGGAEADGRSLLRADWRKFWKAQNDESLLFEQWWERVVQEGVVPNTALPAEEVTLAADWAGEASSPNGGSVEIAFRTDPGVYDGRYANNGWLQELPKQVTAVTWGNAAYMSPKMAQDLGIDLNPSWTAGERGRIYSDVVELTVGERTLRVVAFAQPGIADDVVVLHLGFGRTRAGETGNGVGANAYELRTTENYWSGVIDEPSKTGDREIVACVQFYRNMEGRRPARRATLDYFEENPHFADVGSAAGNEIDLYKQNLPENEGKEPAHDHDHEESEGGESSEEGHHHEPDSRLMPLTMYPPNSEITGVKNYRRWAMAIDLTSCTGCTACVVACQAENNSPVVGREEVTRGREMHWIRIDTYHEGDPADPSHLATHFQPVNCQQCEKAPCELVCPVAATVHSADGLNDMVYNRCVGTRYCSNNCPYKVRRFNFLTYSDYYTESLKLGRNPEVTVRSRGVMEKCTYCVQRIRSAEVVAEREGRPIADGEIHTACESACPSGAIVFGDLSDKASEVNKWKAQPLNYGLLAELNTMPRTSYLASLRNPNDEMPNQEPKGDH